MAAAEFAFVIMIVDTAATGCVFTAIQARQSKGHKHSEAVGRGGVAGAGAGKEQQHHSTELAAAYQTPNIDNDGSHDVPAW